MGEITKTKENSDRHPPGGIFLDRADLAELLFLLRLGRQIQLSRYNLDEIRQRWLLELLSSGRYKEEQRGGNIILKPQTKPDETVCQAIETGVSFGNLRRLLMIPSAYEAIKSVILFPNNSLGTGNVLKGVAIELLPEVKHDDLVRILSHLQWPFGRMLSLFGLRGIDVESFIENFGEGEKLKQDLPLKFADFYYDPQDGTMRLLISGGGVPSGNVLDLFIGSRRERYEKKEFFLSSQEALLRELINSILNKIGRGVEGESITPFTRYVFFKDDIGRLTLFSGATDLKGPIPFNQGPTSNLLLLPSNIHSLIPVGLGKGGRISEIIGSRLEFPEGTGELIPVSNFGL